MIWDESRLRALLGDPSIQWLRHRLRRAVENGRPLPRAVVLQAPTESQREHVARLFGRGYRTEDGALSVDVGRLGALLVEARVCDDLTEALAALDGPIPDRAAEARARSAAWEQLDATIDQRLGGRAWAERWYRELRKTGLLMRMARGDASSASALMDAAFGVVDRWPERGVSLPVLAATVAGDAHALDQGRPLGTLAVRAAAAYGDLDEWQSADGWRESWAAVGVLCDELSAPVLTLGLGAAGDGLTDRVLRVHADVGEACSLSLRQLVRHRPRFDHLAGRPVFVCENAAIVATAVDRLASRAAPLVCTAGYLRGATRLLLRVLADSGAHLHVRADFDIDGLHIAAKTLGLPNAAPWRFDASTYASGAAGPKLNREDVPDTPWDPALSAAMRQRRVGVHEEALLPLLLQDLAARA